MRVLFVHPFFLSESRLERELMTPYPPLGLLSLAAVAREAGHAVAVFDGTFASPGDFPAALAERPDVVCLGALVTLRPAARRLAREARRAGAQVVLGGPDPTDEPAAYLGPRGAADAVIRGEAEMVLPELFGALEAGETRQLPGVVYRANGSSEPAAPVPDLDALPDPARDLVDIPRYLEAWRGAHGYRSLTVSMGRGCPYGCSACAERPGGSPFRLRSPARVADEMRGLEAAYPIDRFRVVDDLEGFPPEWLAELDSALDRAGVSARYEGLMPAPSVTAAYFEPALDLCGRRSRFIPGLGPHGRPAASAERVYAAWARMEPLPAASDP